MRPKNANNQTIPGLNYLISILDHLTKSSTEFVVNKIQSQFNDPSKTLMVWVGAQRQRTSNFRGEEWLWESSKDQVFIKNTAII